MHPDSHSDPSPTAPLRPVPSYQAVVDHLRREMVLGRIRPGDRLPPERRLAEQLGVARETLRQALRILEGSEQIVVPPQGSRGGPMVQAAMADPTAIRRDVERRAGDIVHLAEFRAVVDSAAARLAAHRRTDEDLAAMTAAQAELAAATTLTDSRLADTAFHLAVAYAAGNPELTTAVENARVKMFTPLDLLSFSFHQATSLEGHGLVLDAIRARDADSAAAAMTRHLEATKEEFKQLLGQVEHT